MIRAGIYAGWIGFNNLGDEATFQLCQRRFSDIRWSPFNVIDYTAKPGRFLRQHGHELQQVQRVLTEEIATQRRLKALAVKTKLKVMRMVGREVGLCGGDMFINRNASSLRTYTEIRKRTGAPVPLFGTGVAHPEFWTTRDPNWVDRRKEWVAFFDELPIVGVRGPHSKTDLEEVGARNVVVSGDPAVMLHANYANKPLRLRRDTRLRIGINAGAYPRSWVEPQEIQAAVTALARWLREAGHTVEIVPAWSRDEAACAEVARQAELGSSAVHRVCTSHEDFLHTIEELDLMIAWNLHAGVLAAAANVPIVSLEYQPKCRDFAASIGWEEFLVPTERLQPTTLIDRVSALIEQLDSRRSRLCLAMCRLQETFESYCKQIELLLLN